MIVGRRSALLFDTAGTTTSGRGGGVNFFAATAMAPKPARHTIPSATVRITWPLPEHGEACTFVKKSVQNEAARGLKERRIRGKVGSICLMRGTAGRRGRAAAEEKRDASGRPGAARLCDHRHRLAGGVARLHLAIAGRRTRTFRLQCRDAGAAVRDHRAG